MAWERFPKRHKGHSGFAGCGTSRDEDVNQEEVGEVTVIYVSPQKWHQGHGRSLLRESIGLLRGQGFREVLVWVLKGNQQAIKFYVAGGFAADGVSKLKRRADGPEMHVARYRRSI